MSSPAEDAEIRAIEQVVLALDQLDEEARARVLDYAFKRLGIRSSVNSDYVEQSPERTENLVPEPEPSTSVTRDVRSLRDEKQPRSANEMAAIVAYYLADIAPSDDRKREIGTSDIEKYFKQAGHPLPKAPDQTLRNAMAAGYLDSASRGLYSLNPVGHNLVAHSLPRAAGKSSSAGRGKKRPASSTKRAKRKASRGKSGGGKRTGSKRKK